MTRVLKWIHIYTLYTTIARSVSMLSIFQFVVTTAAVLVLFPSVAVTSAQAQTQGDSCGACNCQFNNVELLIDLIRAEINSTISEQCQGQEGMHANV